MGCPSSVVWRQPTRGAGASCGLWQVVYLHCHTTELPAHGCGRRMTPYAAGAWHDTQQALVTAKVNVITLQCRDGLGASG